MSAVAVLASLDHPAASVGRVRSASWRTWTGRGSMPVASHAEVAVLLRDGSVLVRAAGALCWQWDCAPDGHDPEDIVAFRVRSHAPRPRSDLSTVRREPSTSNRTVRETI